MSSREVMDRESRITPHRLGEWEVYAAGQALNIAQVGNCRSLSERARGRAEIESGTKFDDVREDAVAQHQFSSASRWKAQAPAIGGDKSFFKNRYGSDDTEQVRYSLEVLLIFALRCADTLAGFSYCPMHLECSSDGIAFDSSPTLGTTCVIS